MPEKIVDHLRRLWLKNHLNWNSLIINWKILKMLRVKLWCKNLKNKAMNIVSKVRLVDLVVFKAVLQILGQLVLCFIHLWDLLLVVWMLLTSKNISSHHLAIIKKYMAELARLKQMKRNNKITTTFQNKLVITETPKHSKITAANKKATKVQAPTNQLEWWWHALDKAMLQEVHWCSWNIRCLIRSVKVVLQVIVITYLYRH